MEHQRFERGPATYMAFYHCTMERNTYSYFRLLSWLFYRSDQGQGDILVRVLSYSCVHLGYG